MKITNKLGLSEAFVAAVTNDPYTKGASDISVTELWSPPQQRALVRANYGALEEDAADRVWSLWGSAMHYVLERAGRDVVGHIFEERISTSFEGWKISGQPDALALRSGILTDFKNVSVWSIVKGSRSEDWSLQLSTYAWLLRRQSEPFEVTSLSVEAILRDWSKLEARRNPTYPRHQVHKEAVELIPDGKLTELIRERLKDHAAEVSRPCTPEECWQKPPVWAVMKPGKDRAVKLHQTYDEATAWIAAWGKPRENMYIEEREAKRTRCESYCAAAPFCPQFKEWQVSRGELVEDATNGDML